MEGLNRQVQGRYRTEVATIASGAALSNEIDIEGTHYLALSISSGWTAAGITFQAAAFSSGTFQDIYDNAGTEVSITAASSRCVEINKTAILPLRYIKLRSGTTTLPVNQTVTRTINILMKG